MMDIAQVEEDTALSEPHRHIAHLRQECHNSKIVIFQEKLLKVLKGYNFL
jgi:hypothetical protein